MNNSKFDQKLKIELKKNLNLLIESAYSLTLSLEKCQKIGLKDDLSFEESESFDSLTSKFARTADILTQKVLRTIFILLRERIDTFIDKANSAEKFNIINSAENLIIIRDLRNTIAHEYIPEQLKMLYKEVFEMTEKLLKEIKLTEKFCHKKFNIQILAEN